jgi:uncharacterized repeat protein (TIGR03803 family)
MDGGTSSAGLTMDKAGNLYGTTYTGGIANQGTVFKLIRGKGGSFVFNTLHGFASGEGNGPWAKVTFGPDGSLYGTTQMGIAGSGGYLGIGTVFNLRPPPAACKSALCPWSYSLVYDFPKSGNNGAFPDNAVVFDQNGNMFGTTPSLQSYGNVYELQPSNGGWTQSVLYNFTGGKDGNEPVGDLILDKAGNLYGVTFTGGMNDDGMLYELVRSGSGWTENVIHSFDHTSDGANPGGGLIFDQAGNLYGTTGGNGGWGIGTVFMFSPAGGTWSETVLHNFARNENPEANLTMDAAGNLYGTTLMGGQNGAGTIFKMTPGSGGWTYTVLKEFASNCNDGCNPVSDVTIDASGNLYGTTQVGGAYGQGVVWQITP